MKDLSDLSEEAQYLLSEIIWRIDQCHRMPLDDEPGEDPIRARLLHLAEWLIILMDSGDFSDVGHTIYQLRIDPEEGGLRDLAALLRVPQAEIDAALKESVEDGDANHSEEDGAE